jgi:hypothetical protein
MYVHRDDLRSIRARGIQEDNERLELLEQY